MDASPDVLVIGAGVTGLTTAVCLAEAGCAVRVAAAEPPEATTSAVAGALTAGPAFADPVRDRDKWRPFPDALRWHRQSLAVFAGLATSPGSGVTIRTGRMASRADIGLHPGQRGLPGYRPCAPEESAGFPIAFWMELPVLDMPAYLRYLAARLAASGGGVTRETLPSLHEAATRAPVVVNCAGVGAGALAADESVTPVRGQHVVVENPGFDGFFFEFNPAPESTSLIPHGARLVLGGTAEPGRWSREPDPAQAAQILARCARVEPEVRDAPILDIEVGLRVGRAAMRVADEERVDAARVVHNYGHGSVAVSLSWGCAAAVTGLVTGDRSAS